MNEIEKRIQEYVNSASTLKSDWYAFITNKQYPLEERWHTFQVGLADWKDDTEDSDIPLEHARQIFDSPYDDFNIDRHETKDIDRIIDRLRDKADSGKYEFTHEDVVACMEEAMEKLIASWTWDW